MNELVASWAALEDDEVLDVLMGLQRAQARLAWLEQQALVRLAGPYERVHEILVPDRTGEHHRIVEVKDDVRDEIAAALHRSPAVVHDQITAARLMNGPLAATSGALRDGRISPAHARVIVEQASRLSDASHWTHVDPARDTPVRAADRARFGRACAALQERVLPAAEAQTPAQTRAYARRVLVAVDADAAQRRREQARCTRDVWVSPDEDGIATLVARLDTLTAQSIRAAVDQAAADPAVIGDCGATIGERRAEALAALVLGAAHVTAQIELTVPLSALVGSADDACVLPDGSIVGAEAFRSFVDDPEVGFQVRRLVTDAESGRAIDLGHSRYEVSEPLRRWIAARDRTCRFPGCRRKATACQCDHVRPWNEGGRTDAANLHLLCPRHHQLKTHARWQVSRDDATGITTWTSPLGRVYVVGPEPVLAPTVGPPPDPDPPPF